MPRSKHCHTVNFLFTELGPRHKCPRYNCKGTLVEVWTRYEPRGKIYREQECVECGKVIREPSWRPPTRRWKPRPMKREDQ